MLGSCKIKIKNLKKLSTSKVQGIPFPFVVKNLPNVYSKLPSMYLFSIYWSNESQHYTVYSKQQCVIVVLSVSVLCSALPAECFHSKNQQQLFGASLDKERVQVFKISIASADFVMKLSCHNLFWYCCVLWHHQVEITEKVWCSEKLIIRIPNIED